MKLALISVLFLSTLTGCIELLAFGGGSSSPHSHWEWPKDERTKAREKFEKTHVAQSLHAMGVEFTCSDFCLEVTDDQIALLDRYANEFANLAPKIKRIELSKYDRVLVSSPPGTYIMYIPWQVTEQQLQGVFSTFTKLFELERLSLFKVYVSGTTEAFESALEVLTGNFAKLNHLPIRQIYLTTRPTEYSSYFKIVEFNVDTLNESFATAVSRLELFFEAYAKIPKLVLSVVSNDKSAYDLLEKITAHADEINDLISPLAFHFMIDGEKADTYLAGRSWFGYLVTTYGEIPISQFLDQLKFESYLARLSRKLKMRVNGLNGFSSFSKYPTCAEKIPKLETAIFDKAQRLELIELDYGVEQPAARSRFSDGYLILNCYEDSVDEMLDVIESI